MNVKVISGIVVLIVLAVVAFFAVSKMGSQTATTQLPQTQTTTSPAAALSPTVIPLSPILNELSAWVPTATWDTPKQTTYDSNYGKITGTLVTGEIKGSNMKIRRNYENKDFLTNLGYTEDMNLAADGPGASNWGYKRVVNGKTEIVQFGYSTNRLLGPESNSEPFVNLSVFVSDPFVK